MKAEVPLYLIHLRPFTAGFEPMWQRARKLPAPSLLSRARRGRLFTRSQVSAKRMGR
jgi:hypothetical protein